MGLLSRGSAWQADKFDTNEAVDVVYRRRQQPASPLTVLATQGQSEFEIEDSGPIQRSWRSADFIVTAERLDLDNGDGVFEPQPGDKIETTIEGRLRVYEVMQVPGGPCFRYGQPEQITIRIHTKRVTA